MGYVQQQQWRQLNTN